MQPSKIDQRKVNLKFLSTKTYTHNVGLSCCFRQWKAQSHCRYLHGYALEVQLVFESLQLDECNWVVDFGALRTVKAWLEEKFDHKLLVAEDDPYKHMFLSMDHDEDICDVVIVPATGCESFASMIFDEVDQFMQNYSANPPAQLVSVEVREHAGNSAIVMRNEH